MKTSTILFGVLLTSLIVVPQAVHAQNGNPQTGCQLPDKNVTDPTNHDSTVTQTSRTVIVIGEADGDCCNGKEMPTMPFAKKITSTKVQSKKFSLTFGAIFKRLTWYLTPQTASGGTESNPSLTSSTETDYGPLPSGTVKAAAKQSTVRYLLTYNLTEVETQNVQNAGAVSKTQTDPTVSGPYDVSWGSDQNLQCITPVPAGSDRCAGH